jgi:hypothetical protein
MPTLNYPRRMMRPPADLDEIPERCAWCRRPIGRGEVLSVGKDLGRLAAVCGRCLTPPPIGARVSELSSEGD